MSPEERFERDYEQGRRGGLIEARTILADIRATYRSDEVHAALLKLDEALSAAVKASLAPQS